MHVSTTSRWQQCTNPPSVVRKFRTGFWVGHWQAAAVDGSRLTFLGAFLSFLARAFLGLPSLLSLAGFSLAAALGASGGGEGETAVGTSPGAGGGSSAFAAGVSAF